MGYLTGCEALDVARITKLPLGSSLHRAWEPPDISPEAVRATDRVYLDVTRLDWFDQMRVVWARIGGHHYLRTNR